MLWLTKRSARESNIDALYAELMSAALGRDFFKRHGLDDVFRIRFESACLHLYFILRRLRVFSSVEEEIAQRLVDHFFDGLDNAMRESGVGDVAIPKRMEKFVRAFKARIRSYDDVFAENAPEAASQKFLEECFFDGTEEKTDFACDVRARFMRVQSLSFDALLCGKDVFASSCATELRA